MAYSGPMTGGVAGYDSLLQILWRGWWLILLCAMLVAGRGIPLSAHRHAAV